MSTPVIEDIMFCQLPEAAVFTWSLRSGLFELDLGFDMDDGLSFYSFNIFL